MKIKIKNKFLVFILLFFISIGFAYLAADLGIIGSVTLKKSVWDVHFENVVNENINALAINTPATISNNKLRVNYEVTLDQPGEEYSFYVDVANDSTFDVMVDTITISGLTTEQQKLIVPTVTYSDGISIRQNDVIKENSKEILRVSTKYKDDITINDLPTQDIDFSITIEITYKQADDNSNERIHMDFVNRQVDGVISTGDEIAIGTEHFYVVSSDEETTVLLSKYNLNVGNNIQPGEVGLQNEKTIGVNEDRTTCITVQNNCLYPGSAAFSTNKYWLDENNSIKTKYNYPVAPNVYDVYDNTLADTSGNNYNIAYHVNNYINYLNSKGLNNIKGRLLTYTEAKSLGCTQEGTSRGTCRNTSSDKAFVYSTTYWLGSCLNGSVFMINTDTNSVDNFYYLDNDRIDAMGVRPVIEIPTSYFSPEYTITFNPTGGNLIGSSTYTKKVLDSVIDKYYRLLNLNIDTSASGWNSDGFQQSSVHEEEEYRRFIRETNGKYGGFYYYLNRIPAGEPYLFLTEIRGKGSWLIGHEQGGKMEISPTTKFKKINNQFISDNNNVTSVIFYEHTGRIGNYLDIKNAEVYHLLPEARKNGYLLSGWYTQPEGGTRVNSKTAVKNNATYYARWNANSYKLTIDPNGGTFGQNYNNSTSTITITNRTAELTLTPSIVFDSAVWNNINAARPTREGYTLDGYYDSANIKVYNADGTCVRNTKYFNGSGNYIFAGDLKVFAHWS